MTACVHASRSVRAQRAKVQSHRFQVRRLTFILYAGLDSSGGLALEDPVATARPYGILRICEVAASMAVSPSYTADVYEYDRGKGESHSEPPIDVNAWKLQSLLRLVCATGGVLPVRSQCQR